MSALPADVSVGAPPHGNEAHSRAFVAHATQSLGQHTFSLTASTQSASYHALSAIAERPHTHHVSLPAAIANHIDSVAVAVNTTLRMQRAYPRAGIQTAPHSALSGHTITPQKQLTANFTRQYCVISYGTAIVSVFGTGHVTGSGLLTARHYTFCNRYSKRSSRKVAKACSTPTPPPFYADSTIKWSSVRDSEPLPLWQRKRDNYDTIEAESLRKRLKDLRSQRGRFSKIQRRWVEDHNRRAAKVLAATRRSLRPTHTPQAGFTKPACATAAIIVAASLARKVRRFVKHISTRAEFAVAETTASVTSLVDKIKDSIPEFFGGLRDAAVAALLILAIQKRSVTLAVISASIAFLIPGKGPVARIVLGFLRRSQRAQQTATHTPQSGVTAKFVAAAIVCCYITSNAARDLTRQGRYWIYSTMHNVSRSTMLVSGWDSFLKVFSFTAEAIVNAIGSMFGKQWNFKLFKDPYPDITRHTQALSTYTERVRLGTTDVNCATVRRIRSFIAEDSRLNLRYMRDREANTFLRLSVKDLAYLSDRFGPLITGKTGQRPQPPVVMLCGPPGVGKSLVTTHVCDRVLAAILDPEVKEALEGDYAGEIYLYPTEEDYANGYCGQAAAVFEDVGLGVSAVGDKKADFLRIASLANPYSKPLDQAAIAGKGNSFFLSDFIYCTTNVTNITHYVDGKIHDPNALIRRITVPYVMHLKPEWAEERDGVRQLNKAKYSEFRAAHPLEQPDAWYFVRFDYSRGTVTAPTQALSLDGYILTIVKEIMQNREFYSNSSAYRKAINATPPPAYTPGMTIPTVEYTLAREILPAIPWSRNNSHSPQAGPVSPAEASSTPEDFVADLKHTYRQLVFGSFSPDEEIEAMFNDSVADTQEGDVKEPAADSETQTCEPENTRTYVTGYFEGRTSKEAQAVLLKYKTQLIVDGVYVGSRLPDQVGWTNHEMLCYWAFLELRNLAKHPAPEKCSPLCPFLKRVPKKLHTLGLMLSTIIGLGAVHFLIVHAIGAIKGLTALALGLFNAPVKAVKKIKGVVLRGRRRRRPQSNEEPQQRLKPFINHTHMPNGMSSSLLTHTSTREAIINKAQANTYTVYLGECPIGHATFVRDNVIMMPYHFVRLVRDYTGETMHFSNVVSGQNFDLKTDVVRNADDALGRPQRIDLATSDVTFLRVPHVRAHSDIATYYARRSETERRDKGVSITIRSFVAARDKKADTTNSTAHNCTHERDFLYQGEPCAVKLGYRYSVAFKHGDCGAITYFAQDPKLEQTPLIGMHVAAGRANTGTCNVICREDIEESCRALSAAATKFEGTPYESVMTPQAGVTPLVNMPVVYNLNTPNNVNLRSDLRESEMFGAYGVMPKCSPNFMPFTDANGETVVPLHRALEPYASDVKEMDPCEIREAMSTALRPLCQLTRFHSRKVFDFREAVEGVPGYIKGIPRGTSCSGHYTLRGFTNKRAIFGKDLYEFDTPLAEECFANVESIIADARQGIRQTHVYVEFPKDELLSRPKVELQGKVRLISACPLDLLVATRQYFLAFSAAVMDTKIDNHIAVGINPYADWDHLTSKLRSRGWDNVAGDFSRFDASEQPQMLEEIVHHINAWYDDGPENAKIREILWREVFHSMHLSGYGSSRRDVLQWAKSLPSGHPLTTIINSIYNLTLFHMAWNRLCPVALRGMYYEYCYLCVLGDDNIQNIAKSVIEWWNQGTITQAMAGLHMTYTDESKSGAGVAPTRDLADCTFCKRGFRYDGDTWVGPLDLNSIVWTPYIIRSKAPAPRSILEENIELALGELSLHPSFVWDEWSVKITKAARDIEYLPRRAVMQRTYKNWISGYIPPYV